jgi:WD40 repeat protein
VDTARRILDWRFVGLAGLATTLGIAGALSAQDPGRPRDNDSDPVLKMGPIVCCAMSPDGKRIVAGDSNRVIWVWDPETRKVVRAIQDRSFNRHTITSYAFSRDCKLALVGNQRGIQVGSVPPELAPETLVLWDLETGAKVRAFEVSDEPISWVALSPDGKRALSVGHWKTEKPPAPAGFLQSPWHLDKHLYSLKLWDATDGRLIRCLSNDCGMWPTIFSTDGAHCVLGHVESDIPYGQKQKWALKKWSSDSGLSAAQVTMVPAWHATEIWSIGFSPSAKYVAIGHYAGVSLWNLATGKLEWYHDNQVLRQGAVVSTWSVTAIAFSPDGKRLVVSGPGMHRTNLLPRTANAGMAVLDSATGKLVPGFSATSQWVSAVSFTPDGNRLVGAVVEGIQFWDAQSGKVLFTLQN